jgi:inner membrane protein
MSLATAEFGVSLYQPASVYQQNERAGKYGILFVALTFVAFFLFEILRKLRVHAVQYLLVGVALTTFYVVLLALSEQIGFAWAYLAAASTVVVLIGGYAAAVLRARRAGILLGCVIAVVYALLYGLVVSEQYSLLMGSVALLAVVGALMYLTRKVDWYAYSVTAPLAADGT